MKKPLEKFPLPIALPSDGIFDLPLFQAFVNSLPLAVFCKDYSNPDNRGRLILWNHVAEELWGLAAKDVLGRSDFDFFPKDQAEFFQKKDLETLATHKLVLIPEEPTSSAVMGERIVRTWKVPLISEEGEHRRILIGISQDITEIKKLEIELEQERAKSITNAKLAAIGEVASGVAHEINNPLAIILGHLEKLKKLLKSPEIDPKYFANSVDKMIQTTGRIASIVRGLKTFARDGSQESFRDSSLGEIFQITLDLCAERMHKEEIEFALELHDENFQLHCNSTQVSQVILNLINNARYAIKALPEKWIRIKSSVTDQGLEILVTDSGKGIPETAQKKLFQPFFTTKSVNEGTGLGLSISKAIMQKHEGTLDYVPDAPHTTFRMTIPLVDLDKKAAA